MVATGRPRPVKFNRRRQRASTQVDDSNDEAGPSRAEKRPKASEQPRWACPFWKLDPLKHHTCFSRSQIAPRHVKTHVLREHVAGPKCETCSASFVSRAELEYHLTENRDHSRQLGDVSEDQDYELRSMGRQAAGSDYWYKMWDILFPALPRPESPFVEDPSQFHAGISSFIRANPDLHNLTAVQLMESLLKFGNGGLSSESFPQGTTTHQPASTAPYTATPEKTRQMPLLHPLEKSVVPPTDSGYGSRIDVAASTGFPPGYSAGETNNEYDHFENDVMTSYSEELTMAHSHLYIQKLSRAISHHLGRFLHPENVSDIRAELPEIIRAFAMRIGYESDTSGHRHVMCFVRKHCLPIVNHVVAAVADGSTQDQGSTSCQASQQNMNYLEKMKILWALPDENVQPQLQETMFEGVEGEVEDDTFDMEPNDYNNVVHRSKAFSWLIADLKRLSSLEGSYGDSDQPNGIRSNRQLVIRIFQPGSVSRMEAPQKQTAHFRLFEWAETFQAGNGFDSVVATCLSGNARATSIKHYMAQTWPSTGPQIFSLLQKIIENVDRERTGDLTHYILQENTELTVNVNGSFLVLTVRGTSYTIAEFGEQIAWLWSAVKSPRNNTPHSYTPIVAVAASRFNSGSPDVVTTNSHAMWFDIKFFSNPTESDIDEGLAWSNILGRRAAVLTAYPIPRRPAGFPGLELSFKLLLQLSGGRKPISGERQILIQGGKMNLSLSKRLGDCFAWHRLLPNGDVCSDCGEQAGHCRVSTKFSELQHSSARHFVSRCGLRTSDDFDCHSSPKDEDIRSLDAATVQSLQQGYSKHASHNSGGTTDSSSLDSDSFSMPDTSTEFELSDLFHMSPMIRKAADALLTQYRLVTSTGNSSGSNNKQSSQESTSILSSASQRCQYTGTIGLPKEGRKRKSQQIDDRDESDEERSAQQVSKKPRLQPPKHLACPFWKFQSSAHRPCFSLKLNRIRDVKQHLNRKHTPAYYCDRCCTIFETENKLREHVSHPAGLFCDPSASLGGISRGQHFQLTRKSDKSLCEEEQWFAVWDIVFPGHKRPLSAYLESEIVEDVYLFQDYCRNHGAAVLSTVIQPENPFCPAGETDADSQCHLEAAFRHALDSLLNDWITSRFSGSTSRNNGPNDSCTRPSHELLAPGIQAGSSSDSGIASSMNGSSYSFNPYTAVISRTHGTSAQSAVVQQLADQAEVNGELAPSTGVTNDDTEIFWQESAVDRGLMNDVADFIDIDVFDF